MTTPSDFSFDTYQEKARTTAMYPRQAIAPGEAIPVGNLTYVTLGLCGEAGEVAEKIKKTIRDGKGVITEEKRQELKKELGDVLWYVSNSASELGFSLSEVAQGNIDKLFSRKERGVISGSGDNR